MIKNCVISALFASVFFLFISPEIRAGEPVEIMAGEILVKFKEGTSDEQIKLFVQKYKLTEFGSDPTIQVHFYHSSVDDVTQKVSEITQEKIVKYAQANYVGKRNAIPNDPYYPQQWHLPHIGMPSAWDEFTGNNVIRVAVIDSGINYLNTDLVSLSDTGWDYDYVNWNSYPNDDNGHGTLIAGIIGAKTSNSTGVAGISAKVKIVTLKVSLLFEDYEVFLALNQAKNAGCRVVNLSYGKPTKEPAFEDKLEWLNQQGILVVCSAGNGEFVGDRTLGDNCDIFPQYPSNYSSPNIIAVAATDSSSALTSFSNYGITTVDIAAPGENIFSCLGVLTADEYREPIANWTFDSGSDDWTQRTITGQGFGWDSVRGGLFSISNYLGVYWPNTLAYLQSPDIDCTNYVASKLTTLGTGGLEFGDYLKIYSGTSTFERATMYSTLPADINGINTVSISAIDQSVGRAWYWFTTDSYYNSYFGILDAEVTGIPMYGGYNGTSFAAPVVTGVAAMLMSQNPQLTHLQVKDIILQTARKVSALNGKVVCGGIVDAAAALREAKARIVVMPAITSSTSASGTVGSSFSYSITASGTATSYNASSLPSGLSVNTSTGVISGAPTAAGTFTSSISASNIAGTGSANLTIAIAKGTPTITSDVSPASIRLSSPFSHQITASGSPTSFGAIRLPPGLKINAKTGLISGKPTKVGTFSATLQALKKGSTTATATKVFTVVQIPTFTYAAKINAQRGKAVKVAPKIAGYPAPTFSIISGSLPPGLSLNASTAAITGKPTAAGSYAFTVRGSNSAGNTDRSVTIVVK